MKCTLAILAALLLVPVAAVRGDDLPFPDGIRHVRVERSDSDRYKFLHDPAIEAHNGELFAAWYNCPQQEIVGESLIRGRRSSDGGQTWGGLEVIASDTSGDGTYYVPVQLLSHGGVLHAFVGTMRGGHDLIKSCAVYVLDGASNRWQPRGEIADLFLPNCRPVRMDDGNWIMAGRAASRVGAKPLIPAVAISKGDDLTGRWTVVPLQAEMTPEKCPETTVWVEGGSVMALTRNDTGPVPFVYASQDHGRTWTTVEQHPLRASAVKLYAGHLSTGDRYVVFNLPADGEKGFRSRETLVIQVSRRGALAPAKTLRVQARTAADSSAVHYPCAVEHDGNLHVIYTVGTASPRQCELAIIPIASLAAVHGADTARGGLLERRGLPRVLFNNDSDDLKFAAYPETHGALWVPAGELVPRREITSVDDYLSYRIGPLAKTAVSGLSYCGNFGSPVWDLRRDHVAGLGEDPLQPILGLWRRDGRRFFFSMRMNDKHHAWFNWPHLWDEFRRTHRHWFLAPPTEAEWTDDFLPWLNDPTKPSSTEFIAKVTTRPQKLRRDSDALLYDYSKPEVRSHYLDVLREACRRYDIDGVELDWLRYPRFFREGEVDAAVITAFVRDARSILDEAATRRGHPLRLVTRVPDSPGSARRIGLDVEAWLEAGWIDAVIAGHGFTFNSNELDQWVAVAHRHHVPVYGVLERMPRGFARYGTPETLRAAAATLWARGADGLYLFNFYNTAEYPLLADLADPARLALRPKEFFLDACWVTDNGTVSKPPLPLIVQAGSPARATLFLTDDPAHATDLELELAWKGAGDFAAPDVVVNGRKLEGLNLDRGKAPFAAVSAVRLEKGETPLTVSCSAALAELFHRGTNECVFTSTSDVTLTALALKIMPAPTTAPPSQQ